MPFLGIEVFLRFLCVILVVIQNLPLDQVFVNDYLSYENIYGFCRNLRRILTETRRYDVLELLHETAVEGNLRLLEQYERDYIPFRDRFHSDPNHAAHEWPALCYRFTENNNPVRAETGFTENGNILALDTEK